MIMGAQSEEVQKVPSFTTLRQGDARCAACPNIEIGSSAWHLVRSVVGLLPSVDNEGGTKKTIILTVADGLTSARAGSVVRTGVRHGSV